MINWLLLHKDVITTTISVATFLISFATLAFSAFRFVEVRREEQKQRRFENYHKLIAELVGGARDNQQMKLDSQVAVIFELRNFSEYSEVTIRILNGLLEEWANHNKPRLLQELRFTIDALT